MIYFAGFDEESNLLILHPWDQDDDGNDIPNIYDYTCYFTLDGSAPDTSSLRCGLIALLLRHRLFIL